MAKDTRGLASPRRDTNTHTVPRAPPSLSSSLPRRPTRERSPRACSLRLRGVWTPHAPGSGRCPLEFVWPPPREREPGNFSTEKGEAFGLGRVRVSERVPGSSPSLFTWQPAWSMSGANSLAARPWLPRGWSRPGRSVGRSRGIRIPRKSNDVDSMAKKQKSLCSLPPVQVISVTQFTKRLLLQMDALIEWVRKNSELNFQNSSLKPEE